MSKLMMFLSAFLFLAVFPVGCSEDAGVNPFEERALPAELQSEARSIVDGNNRFALDLYRALKDEDGNLFLSPYSVSTALAMVFAGARGTTEAEMAQVLHFDSPQDQLHTIYGELQASLDRGTSIGGYELAIANRLWGERDFTFLDPFLDITRVHYAAELARVNFSGDPEGTRETINAWVEDKTRDKIKDLLAPGTVSNMTRLVLTNAIYFNGLWASQFDPDDTHEGTFYLDKNEQVTTPMMHQETEFPYAAVDQIKILEMPYEGEDLSMIAILPEEIDGLGALEDEITSEKLDAWMRRLESTEIEVSFPSFKYTSKFTLNETLVAMGMPSAFNPAVADFSGMTGGRDLFIAFAIHKAFVDVNEEGTEAAAATAVGMELTSLPPAKPRFTANHPFLFMIRDNVTGSILFIGRVMNPLE